MTNDLRLHLKFFNILTSDGESLANASATSGYSMRNGKMHWGLDFGANGSFKQNQAKRTLLIAPEWEDRKLKWHYFTQR